MSASALDLKLLRLVYEGCGRPPVRFELWDGSGITPATDQPPVATMRVRDRAALLGLILRAEVGFGEGYIKGRIEVEGDFRTFLGEMYRGREPESPPCALSRLLYRLRRWRLNSLTGARSNIHHHYDIGNDFYTMWLGKEMQYSGAYFPDMEASLEAAQQAKMELICRKVWLRPGDRVVDAGCGWGSLARYMARNYGARVWAFNISREQLELARELTEAEGLDNQIELIEDDYRNISGNCDVFVSVGALEHFGPEHYRKLGHVIHRCLDDHGRGLIQTIGRNRFTPMHPWLAKRIFPGAHPPSLQEMAEIFEHDNLSILDIENLRLHYDRTARIWLERFEQCRDQVEEMFDATFVRAWRLYLAGVGAGFEFGQIQLFQVLFSRGESNLIPWSRSEIYERPMM